MCRVAQHVDVEQFGHIAAAVRVVLVTERVPDGGTLLVHYAALVRSRAGRPDLADQVPQPLWGWHGDGLQCKRLQRLE